MWLQQLNESGITIPDLQPTKDGSCASDPAFAADAQNRGWWTCGGWTQPSDIVACPDKGTWGVSFDDGPGPYSACSSHNFLYRCLISTYSHSLLLAQYVQGLFLLRYIPF